MDQQKDVVFRYDDRQLRPNYVHNLNNYLKTLEQRNQYLRQIQRRT